MIFFFLRIFCIRIKKANDWLWIIFESEIHLHTKRSKHQRGMNLMLKEFIMMVSVTIDMIKWPWVIAGMNFIDKHPGLSILVPILNKEWNSDWLLGTTNCLLVCRQRHCKYTGGSIMDQVSVQTTLYETSFRINSSYQHGLWC